MTVSKETILLYLLNELDIDRQDEVDKALREDKELHAYYRARLAEFEEEGILAPPYEMDEDDEDLEDLNEDPIVLIGDEEFDQYAHLPAEEAARRFILDQLNKRIESVEPGPVVRASPPFITASYDKGASLSVAARDTQSKPASKETEPQSDRLVWGNGDDYQILLTFTSIIDRKRLRVRIQFTVDTGTRLRHETDAIEFTQDTNNPRLWRGAFSLKDFNLKTGQGTIITLKGQIDE